MRTQPQEVIKQLEAHNSRLDKESIIFGAMGEGLDEFFEGVTMALDPLVTFGVKQVPEKEENTNKTSVGEIVGYTTSLVSIIALMKSF